MNDKRPGQNQAVEFTKENTEVAHKATAIILIIIGLVSFFVVLSNQPLLLSCGTKTTNEITQIRDYWTIKGTMGDFTGGIVGTLFSLAGFILLYLSFKKQTEANVTQLLAYNHDKVEGRFFELLKLHRDNVSEFKFITTKFKYNSLNGTYKATEHHTIYENRHFFVAVMDQVKAAYKELGYFFNGKGHNDIYEDDYLALLKNNETLNERAIDLVKYAKIDLVYLIVFFGVSEEGQSTIKSLTAKKYRESFVDQLLKTAALKPVENSKFWSKWEKNQDDKDLVYINEELIKAYSGKPSTILQSEPWADKDKKHFPNEPYYPNDFVKYYGGHQFRLGHYFRHIFHTISFINDNIELSSKDQYSYIKHLRGQLSTNEQILIFLNSLSQLGRIWELEDKKSGGPVERWKQIMSDYMVIKNIPNDEILDGIKLSEFYPGIVYEGFEVKK